MLDPSSDPERYTIDEIMERLKGHDSSDSLPKTVTRADGSQAIKVRKRKRRTNQTKRRETKRNTTLQLIQVAGSVILVVLVGLAAGIGLLYANSSGFRDSLLVKLEDSTGADVKLTQFRVNPATADARRVLMKWPHGNPLSTLDLTSVAAEIAPQTFLGKIFRGEEIIAAKGRLLLRNPDASKRARHRSAPGGDPSVKFNRYSVPSLDILFGEMPASRRSLIGTEASYYTGTSGDRSEIRLRGGMFAFEDWPHFALDRSYIRIIDGKFQISSMRFLVPENVDRRKAPRGSIDLFGTVNPLETDVTNTLGTKVQGMLLPYLLGESAGRFFKGNVDQVETPDSNFVKFSIESPASALMELTLTNSVDSRIGLGGFVFLSQLSSLLDDRWYESPQFGDDVSFVVRRKGNDVTINEINLLSRGRMAIRGSLSSGNGGVVAGSLHVGLPSATVSAAKNKRVKRIFGSTRGDYRWLDITIGGTSAIPTDNFKEIYSALESEPPSHPKADHEQRHSFDQLIDGVR